MRFLLVAGDADSLISFRGELVSELLGMGYEVHVAAPELQRPSPLKSALQGMGLRVHHLSLQRAGLNPLSDLRALVGLLGLMMRIRPDTVLAYTIKPVIYGMLAARLANVERRFALITGLGYAFYAEGKAAWIHAVAKKLYALALSGADKVFFQNVDDECLFRDLGIIPGAVPSCVMNGSGVELDYYAPVAFPAEGGRFLLIARLLAGKGVREYVAAARLLKPRYPDAVFYLLGPLDVNPDSIGNEELQEWVQEGVVEYLGAVEDVRPAIRNCSVYVLPSYREGTPRTVLEAMAMGRPVITTDVPGCRQTVVDGCNGVLVPVKSIDALADAMESFLLKPDMVGRMGDNARKIAEEKYDVHKVNGVMLKEMGLS